MSVLGTGEEVSLVVERVSGVSNGGNLSTSALIPI